MTSTLTWHELSTLKAGAVVAFANNYDVKTRNGMVGIGAGMPCVIEDNGLNEIWGGVIVRPLERVVKELLYHQDGVDGLILIGNTPEPGEAEEWAAASPFTLHDTCPPECIA